MTATALAPNALAEIASKLAPSHIRSVDTFNELTNRISRRDRRVFARTHGEVTASPARWSHENRMLACTQYDIAPVLGVGGAKFVKEIFGIDVEALADETPAEYTAGVAAHTPDEFDMSTDVDVDNADEAAPDGDPFADVIKVPAAKRKDVFVQPTKDEHFVVSPAIKNTLRVIEKISNKRSVNVALTGPTGTGKTSLAEWFAWRTNRPFFIFDAPSIREPQEAFGFKTLEADGKGGTNVRLQLSGLMQAVRTPRACILIDEATRVHASLLNGLLALLDHRKRVWIDALQETIEVAEGVVFFVTANLGSQYTGTWRWDIAFENRMDFRVEVNYLEEANETELLCRKQNIDKTTSRKLVDIANLVRRRVVDPKDALSHAISTRQLLVTAEAISNGMTPLEALDSTVVNTYSPEGGTTSHRANVLQIIQGKLGA